MAAQLKTPLAMTDFSKQKAGPLLLLILLLAYIGSYLAMSIQGRYEPAATGSYGVKWYAWVPRDFLPDFRGNASVRVAYMPLYWLDINFWHTSDDAWSGRYPIHRM